MAMPALEKPRRHRSRLHLKHVRTLRCLGCAEPAPSQAHHLTFAQPKARGLKSGDQWSVPLCMTCHNALHARGNERAWWEAVGVDPIEVAGRLWAHTLAEREKHESEEIKGTSPPSGIKRRRARDAKASRPSRHAWSRPAPAEPEAGSDNPECVGDRRALRKDGRPSRRWPSAPLRKGISSFSRDKVRI